MGRHYAQRIERSYNEKPIKPLKMFLLTSLFKGTSDRSDTQRCNEVLQFKWIYFISNLHPPSLDVVYSTIIVWVGWTCCKCSYPLYNKKDFPQQENHHCQIV